MTDIHIHLLSGVDDGAKSEEEMYAILDAAYADGTRTICATPHFYPDCFGDNSVEITAAFEKLENYAKKYDDLKLFLGNELRYKSNYQSWINSGHCITVNNSRYLLVDFAENDSAEHIVTSVLRLLNSGYVPILAHAERYNSFHADFREIRKIQECGALIQIDAQSPFGGWGPGAKRRSRRLIRNYFADVVASDAHDTNHRPPKMSECYQFVEDKCGKKYADQIFRINPTDILNDVEIRKDFN